VYPYRVALAVPYWDAATYRAIRRSLVCGNVTAGPDLAALESLLGRTLGVENVVLCGSGSLALEIALRSCGVGAGDEVVIPTFCCTAVVPPVLALGAIPVLADAGGELNVTVETVEAALTEKTTAVVVPHLFGNPADIEAIVDLARGRGIRVIDDAAQALGAAIGGRPAGRFGDAGILSFGNEKICSGVGGGAAIIPGGNEIPLTLPRLSSTLGTLVSVLIRRRWRRWTFPAEGWFSPTAGPDSPPAPYRPEAMADLNAAVAATLIRTLRDNIAARRARAGAYKELLGTDERLALIPHRPGSACLTQVARLFPHKRGEDPAADLIATLGREGYEVQGSYVPIHLMDRYEKWRRTPLPQSERVWADLVELPCEPQVSFDDVERIATIVKSCL
jgi:dTDP-4-amino-4,6-dideoxygalactose transaminase